MYVNMAVLKLQLQILVATIIMLIFDELLFSCIIVSPQNGLLIKF